MGPIPDIRLDGLKLGAYDIGKHVMQSMDLKRRCKHLLGEYRT